MQAVIKIIATIALLGAAVIGILIVLDLISNATAQDVIIKTGWILGIIAVVSLLLLFMGGGQKRQE